MDAAVIEARADADDCARRAYQASLEAGPAIGSLGDLGRAPNVLRPGYEPPSSVGPYVRLGFQHPLSGWGRLCLRGEGFASVLAYAGGHFGSPRNPLERVNDGAMLVDLGWMFRSEVELTSSLFVAPGVGVGIGIWRYASALADGTDGADGAIPAADLRLDVPIRIHIAGPHRISLTPGLVLLLPPLGDGGETRAANGNIGVYDIQAPPRSAYAMDRARISVTLSAGYAFAF